MASSADRHRGPRFDWRSDVIRDAVGSLSPASRSAAPTPKFHLADPAGDSTPTHASSSYVVALPHGSLVSGTKQKRADKYASVDQPPGIVPSDKSSLPSLPPLKPASTASSIARGDQRSEGRVPRSSRRPGQLVPLPRAEGSTVQPLGVSSGPGILHAGQQSRS